MKPVLAHEIPREEAHPANLHPQPAPVHRPPAAALASILGAVGNTPVVQLSRFLGPGRMRVLAKLESFNPGGSLKDRPALRIIQTALAEGALGPGSVVIESKLGNMGIGLAQVCGYYGLRFICVVDPKTTKANADILRAYGAEVDCVPEPDPETGEFLQARLHRVQELLRTLPNGFWPNQYANARNAESHYRTTIEEIFRDCGEIDYLLVATSTCGTLRGCADFLRDHRLSTRLIAVDAVGSVIFGGEKKKRLLPGMGAALTPPLCPAGAVDRVLYVSDLDSIVGCRRLLRRESIFAGASSGGVMAAVERLAEEADPRSTCVAILPDRGERYLDTVYSNEWVQEHFGPVEHLWTGGKPPAPRLVPALVRGG